MQQQGLALGTRTDRSGGGQEARNPGGLRLSPTVFSPHGIDLWYSASIVLSAAGKHRRRTKETKAEYRHGAFGRPGVASRHSSQSGCRIRPCEDAPLRAAAAAAAAKPFTASRQACLPVSLSCLLCSAQTAESGNCGQIARLNCGKAGAGTREATSEDAKIRKWRKLALGERERRGRELVLHCKVRSRVRAEVQPCKIARRCCIVVLIEREGLSWSRRFSPICPDCPDLPWRGSMLTQGREMHLAAIDPAHKTHNFQVPGPSSRLSRPTRPKAVSCIPAHSAGDNARRQRSGSSLARSQS